MKNVLYVIKGLGRGGAEQLLVNIVRHLDASRFRSDVAFLLPRKTALVGELEKMGVAVHCLDGARGVGWIARLRKLTRDRRIDIAHVHSPLPAVAARVTLGRVPLVYTEHNVWQRYHRATYWGNALTFPLNRHVFAVSDHVRESIRYPMSLRFLPMPAVETLYHGIGPEVFAQPPSSFQVREELGIPMDAPVVGSVANLKLHKGHGYLLQAAVLVRRSVPDVRFVLVGLGPLEDELRQRALDLGLDGSVVFAGFREDPLRIGTAFDAFVLASVHEGLSIALLEAMALGKPPLVTAVGGLPEVVEHERQGLVVPPADPRALAEGLVRLLTDDELRQRLGAAARLRARMFDIRNAVRRMEDVYEAVLR